MKESKLIYKGIIVKAQMTKLRSLFKYEPA